MATLADRNPGGAVMFDALSRLYRYLDPRWSWFWNAAPVLAPIILLVIALNIFDEIVPCHAMSYSIMMGEEYLVTGSYMTSEMLAEIYFLGLSGLVLYVLLFVVFVILMFPRNRIVRPKKRETKPGRLARFFALTDFNGLGKIAIFFRILLIVAFVILMFHSLSWFKLIYSGYADSWISEFITYINPRNSISCVLMELMIPLDFIHDIPASEDYFYYGESLGNLRSSLEDSSEPLIAFVLFVLFYLALSNGEIAARVNRHNYGRFARRLNLLLRLAASSMVVAIVVVYFFASVAASSWGQVNPVIADNDGQALASVVTTYFAVLGSVMLVGIFAVPMFRLSRYRPASDDAEENEGINIWHTARQVLLLVSPILAAEVTSLLANVPAAFG